MSPDALKFLFSSASALRSQARWPAAIRRWRSGRRVSHCSRGRGAEDLRGRAVSGVRCTFIIMRNTLRGAKIERRRFEFVMMAPYSRASGA